MLRKAASKVLWLGRATSTVLGLVVILALILGVATAALGATSKAVPFNLGQINTSNAVSTLVGAVSGSNLKIENTNTDPNANPTALELKVPPGKAPLKVNSDAGRAENLDADKLDEWDSSDFVRKGIDAGGDLYGTYPNPQVGHADKAGDADTLDGRDFSAFNVATVIDRNGPLPLQGTYTSKGGTLIISVSGSGFRSSSNTRGAGNIGMDVEVQAPDGSSNGWQPGAYVFANERDSHKAFVDNQFIVTDMPAGQVTIGLNPSYDTFQCNTDRETIHSWCTTTNQDDWFTVHVLEIPD